MRFMVSKGQDTGCRSRYGRRMIAPAAASVLSLVLTVLVGCGDSEQTRAIKIDQVPLPDGKIDLVLTVTEDLNTLDTTSGSAQVLVTCGDNSGTPTVRSRQRWPLLKDGDPPLPHVHLILPPSKARATAVCTIGGTSPKLVGRPGLGR